MRPDPSSPPPPDRFYASGPRDYAEKQKLLEGWHKRYEEGQSQEEQIAGYYRDQAKIKASNAGKGILALIGVGIGLLIIGGIFGSGVAVGLLVLLVILAGGLRFWIVF